MQLSNLNTNLTLNMNKEDLDMNPRKPSIACQEAQDLPVIFPYLLGRRITCMTSKSLIQSINEACRNNKKITVSNYNVHSFNMSVQHSWFYKFIQDSDIAHCDGLGIIYALRFLGYKVPIDYRVSYTVLMPKLLENCENKGLSVYLLGAKNQNLQTALENIQKEYPNIRISGHHGYFDFNDRITNQKIVSEINKYNANILIVGMGMPLQEYWVQQHKEQLKVNSILLGGAVIDRLAGVVPICPEILGKNGLEWLYRLFKEPKRLLARYLLGNPAFLLQVALAKSMQHSFDESIYVEASKLSVLNNLKVKINFFNG
jgi:N-acetylglucosaminyldiphosphoundecaprenol N-acetyl-beta-D-mannosaminyltransferase